MIPNAGNTTVGNQNVWRKRIVMEGSARKGDGETGICAVFCSFTLVKAQTSRCFTDLPYRKGLQTICMK